jgi:hypothetical protein
MPTAPVHLRAREIPKGPGCMTFGESMVADLVSRDIGINPGVVIAYVSGMINTVKRLREE